MVNTIEIIKREMKKTHLNVSELSRKLGLHQTTVHGMLQRKTLQVQKLADLSEVMQYNFFREIAEQFPYEQPVYEDVFKQKETAFTEEINRLKEENKTLNIKVEVLKEVIEKIGH